jgi:DNA-binding NtrC family response regulator
MSKTDSGDRRPPPGLDLVVLDDDRDYCQYLVDVLSDDGHRVRFVHEPEDLARALLEQPPDLLLLDMKMGRFRGEEVLADLRKTHPDLCVVVVTGHPSLDDMRATFREKAFDYISKPFSLVELRDVLERAANTHGLLHRNPERLRQRMGHRLKVLRTEKRWGLKDLAERSGVSVSQISSIERGAHLPSMDSLLSLCASLAIRPSVLLRDIGF